MKIKEDNKHNLKEYPFEDPIQRELNELRTELKKALKEEREREKKNKSIWTRKPRKKQKLVDTVRFLIYKVAVRAKKRMARMRRRKDRDPFRKVRLPINYERILKEVIIPAIVIGVMALIYLWADKIFPWESYENGDFTENFIFYGTLIKIGISIYWARKFIWIDNELMVFVYLINDYIITMVFIWKCGIMAGNVNIVAPLFKDFLKPWKWWRWRWKW